jgi:hypothetical protein
MSRVRSYAAFLRAAVSIALVELLTLAEPAGRRWFE